MKLTTKGRLVLGALAGIALLALGGTGIELGWRPIFPLVMASFFGTASTILFTMYASYESGPLTTTNPNKPRTF